MLQLCFYENDVGPEKFDVRQDDVNPREDDGRNRGAAARRLQKPERLRADDTRSPGSVIRSELVKSSSVFAAFERFLHKGLRLTEAQRDIAALVVHHATGACRDPAIGAEDKALQAAALFAASSHRGRDVGGPIGSLYDAVLAVRVATPPQEDTARDELIERAARLVGRCSELAELAGRCKPPTLEPHWVMRLDPATGEYNRQVFEWVNGLAATVATCCLHAKVDEPLAALLLRNLAADGPGAAAGPPGGAEMLRQHLLPPPPPPPRPPPSKRQRGGAAASGSDSRASGLSALSAGDGTPEESVRREIRKRLLPAEAGAEHWSLCRILQHLMWRRC